MNLFSALTYALISLGLLSLLLAEIASWPVSLLVGALVAASPFRQRLGLAFSRRTTNGVVLAVLGFLLWGAVVGGPSIYVRQLLYFSLVLMVAKLYGPKKYRDHLQIFLISAFYLIAATMKLASLSFLLIFLVFLALALAYLTLLNLRRDADWCAATLQVPPGKGVGPPESEDDYRLPVSVRRPLGRAFFWRTCRCFGFVLALSTVGFYAIPRFTLRMFARPQELVELNTGFSESVELGNLGEIISNQSPVMKVFIELAPPRSRVGLRWRGITLDEFDGTAWRVSEEIRSGETFVFLQAGKTFPLPRAGADDYNTVQLFELEPINTETVFTQPEALSVQLEGAPPRWPIAWLNIYSLRVQALADNLFFSPIARRAYQEAFRRWKVDNPQDANETEFIRRLPRPPALHQPLTYRVYSQAGTPEAARLRQVGEEDPEPIRRTYLQLPQGMEGVAQLARSVVQDQTNRYDRAEAIELFLRREFDYTLAPAPENRDMTLEQFLLEVRRGHCEYFSAAMGVMLRTLGIPARVVNGFVGSEYHRFGGYYQVRQSDAHSWVEVFFPGYGWVPFDPTPPQRGGTFHLARTLRQLFDTIQSGWVKYVVDYSFNQQRYLFRGLYTFLKPSRTGGAWSFQEAGGATAGLPWHVAWLVIGLLAVALIAWRVYFLRRPRQVPLDLPEKRSSPDVRSAIHFYQRLLKLLAQRGFQRRPGQTPGELARAVAASAPALGEPVRTVTEVYYTVRYGKRPLSPLLRRRLQHLLRDIRKQPAPELQHERPPGGSTPGTQSSIE